MPQLTDEMKTAVDNALADKAPCIVATASTDGKPGIGYRGSVMAYGDFGLAYWERTFRQGSENIETNPHVVVLYRNPETRKAWKFFGRAEVHKNDDIREDVMSRTVKAELDRDVDKKGVAVVITLDRVEMMSGEVVLSAE